jgi:predicted transcriptional regulator
MYTFTVAIPPDAAERLRELARRERRSPRQQAAVLVLAALEREIPAATPPCGEEAAACPRSQRDLHAGARR